MQEKVTTVRRRIFLSNTVMVLTTLVLFFMINLVMIKIYAESVEEELILSVENAKNVEMEGGLDELLEGWTIHREQFFIYFGIDGILCIGVLLLVDGRQTSTRGMFLDEMAKVFESLGCKAAYNLDGGHCSFMTYEGKVANHPYKPEYEVEDGIFLVNS